VPRVSTLPSMQTRTPGALQGIMLLLPITMAVMGISVLTPVVHLMLAQFPDHEYLVIGGILTMPAIWVLLFSPIAGWRIATGGAICSSCRCSFTPSSAWRRRF